jgi:hypothetical protein
MPPHLWRLYRAQHGPGLDGSAGLFADGRWHARGERVVYFGGSAAIVVLERLAHTDPDLLPRRSRTGPPRVFRAGHACPRRSTHCIPMHRVCDWLPGGGSILTPA